MAGGGGEGRKRGRGRRGKRGGGEERVARIAMKGVLNSLSTYRYS